MSRNIRQKYPAAQAQAQPTKRRLSTSSSSLTDLSDDDGYSGVEDISDSEDEEAVHAAEEEHMISRARRRKGTHGSPRPPADDDSDNSDDDADEEDGDEDDEDLDEQVEHEDADDGGDDGGSWNGILSETEGIAGSQPGANGFMTEQDVTSVERHVRFAGLSDSDSDSTTTDTTNDIDEFFPDIFVAQSALDPAFRREIEYDPDESSNSGTFWDFHGIYEHIAGQTDDDVVEEPESQEDTPVATPLASQVQSGISTPVQPSPIQELDGYETDGDTTEEDTPEPCSSQRNQARRVHSSDSASDSEIDRPIRFRRGKPRTGKFHLDSSDKKPVAMVHPVSGKMLIFTPQRLRKLDLSPESFDLQFFGNSTVTQSSPIISNSASLMMSAMFSSNTFGDFMNTQAVGPAEAFFPFPSSGITVEDTEDSDADAEEDEAERNLKLDDFVTFHHHSSEDEEESDREDDANAARKAGGVEATACTSRPTTAASDASMPDAHPLLNHFDNNSDAVGAFRRNQAVHQLISSNKASREALAFSNGIQQGTLKGIKPGSLDTVMTPIAPLRRRKRGSMNGETQPLELSNPPEGSNQKRKATSAASESSMSLHKRHRSISDVEMIQI